MPCDSKGSNSRVLQKWIALILVLFLGNPERAGAIMRARGKPAASWSHRVLFRPETTSYFSKQELPE